MAKRKRLGGPLQNYTSQYAHKNPTPISHQHAPRDSIRQYWPEETSLRAKVIPLLNQGPT